MNMSTSQQFLVYFTSRYNHTCIVSFLYNIECVFCTVKLMNSIMILRILLTC